MLWVDDVMSIAARQFNTTPKAVSTWGDRFRALGVGWLARPLLKDVMWLLDQPSGRAARADPRTYRAHFGLDKPASTANRPRHPIACTARSVGAGGRRPVLRGDYRRGRYRRNTRLLKRHFA